MRKKPLSVLTIALLLIGQYIVAQNLGGSPQFNVAVQALPGSLNSGSRTEPEV